MGPCPSHKSLSISHNTQVVLCCCKSLLSTSFVGQSINQPSYCFLSIASTTGREGCCLVHWAYEREHKQYEQTNQTCWFDAFGCWEGFQYYGVRVLLEPCRPSWTKRVTHLHYVGDANKNKSLTRIIIGCSKVSV